MGAFLFIGVVGVGGGSALLGPLISNMGAIDTLPLAWVTTKPALHPESRCLLMFFSRTRALQTGLSEREDQDKYQRNVRP